MNIIIEAHIAFAHVSRTCICYTPETFSTKRIFKRKNICINLQPLKPNNNNGGAREISEIRDAQRLESNQMSFVCKCV